LRYFPVGYGNALRETPEQIRELTRVILGQLEEEPDPWLVTFHDRIALAWATFVAAQELDDTAVRDRRDAFAYLVAERRSWVHALSVSRLKATIACLDDPAYVRGIFSPADVRRRATVPTSADGDGLPETTSRPDAREVLTSLHLLPASAVTPVQALTVTPAKAPADQLSAPPLRLIDRRTDVFRRLTALGLRWKIEPGARSRRVSHAETSPN
jgi:hypothetical protein